MKLILEKKLGKEDSELIEELIQNAAQVKNVLGDGLNTTVSDSGVEKAIQDQKELAQTSTQSTNTVVQAEERKQNEEKKRQEYYANKPQEVVEPIKEEKQVVQLIQMEYKESFWDKIKNMLGAFLKKK